MKFDPHMTLRVR